MSPCSSFHGSDGQYYTLCWHARHTKPAFSILFCSFLSNNLLRKISVYILGVEHVPVPACDVCDVAVLPHKCI